MRGYVRALGEPASPDWIRPPGLTASITMSAAASSTSVRPTTWNGRLPLVLRVFSTCRSPSCTAVTASTPTTAPETVRGPPTMSIVNTTKVWAR